MSVRTRPPEELRDAPVDWMGAVPRSWLTPPLYATYDVQLGKMLNPDAAQGDHLAPYLRNVDVQWDRISVEALPEMNFPREFASRYRLQPGDLLVCEGGEVGRAAIWEGQLLECYYQKALHRLRPRRNGQDRRFMYYAIYAAAHRGAFEEGGSKSTILHLPAEKLRRHRFPMPSDEEQQAVVCYLDSKTAAIDALIAKKERLIELLEEKRQALITRAVTKGLDPTVPMKDSGIEWLGPIPAHWKRCALRYAAMFQRGHDLPAEARVDGSVPVVSSAGVIATHSQVAARGPGIVTGRYGSIGKFHLIEEDYWPLNTALYTRSLCGNAPGFLWYALSSMEPFFVLESKKSAVPGVDRNDLHQYPIAIPPLSEQHAIAAELDRECGRIHAIIAQTRESLDRLREYRQALITAAVTGKIDVTGEVT